MLTTMDSQQKTREFVLAALAKTGWSPTELARRAGKAPSTLNRFLNDPDIKHTLSTPTLDAIAAAAGMTSPVEISTRTMEATPLQRIPINSVGAEDLPILGEGEGGTDGRFVMNGQIQGYAFRPRQLVGIMTGYGVYIHGDSMEPKYESGQLLYVNPNKPPRIMDYVIVQFRDERALVKRLIKRDNMRIVLRQFNPPLDIEFQLSDIKDIHKIVTADEA